VYNRTHDEGTADRRSARGFDREIRTPVDHHGKLAAFW
jgi:hypothetical protein